ncbi:MAG: hypothetical protein J0L88_13465 [Xanthomonadales bacterium]|nr:hypothetical protein [Xanthomonadales bacterium]
MHRSIGLAVLFATVLANGGKAAARDAEEALQPTELRTLGDCLAARLIAPNNVRQRGIDRAACAQAHRDDDAARDVCLRNLAVRRGVAFFSDRCGVEDGVFALSLDGVEYRMTRQAPALEGDDAMVGAFGGDGVELVVTPGRPVPAPAATDDDGFIADRDVVVDVRKGGQHRRIRAVLQQGP